MIASLLFSIIVFIMTGAQGATVPMYQKDFEKGTLIIGTGSYILMEDVTFCPRPMPPSKIYDPNAFALGFFAAILVSGNNVNINLNGHTLQLCKELMLMQRFFALISLSSAPFTAGNGPHEFVGTSTFVASENVTITGPGTLRQSSHHCIQGNENKNILIKGIKFEEYEVAAIHLNNVDGLTIEDCQIIGTRQDVPVLATFSSAIFIRKYVEELMKIDYRMKLRGKSISAAEVHNALSKSIDNVRNDVMATGRINKVTHPEEFKLFDNPLRVPEGTCYGILVYGHGPASNGFALEVEEADESSSNIIIRRNTIGNIKCMTKEVPAAITNATVVNDARGAVLQFFDSFTNEGLAMNMFDGSYKGNVVADAQIMTASAIHEGVFQRIGSSPQLVLTLNTIPKEIINWAAGRAPAYRPKFRCLSDSMHHVTKGIIGIRLEETFGFEIDSNTIDGVVNLTPLQYSPKLGCYDVHELVDEENGSNAQDANVRGISVSAARAFSDSIQSKITKNTLRNFSSKNGRNITGISIQGDAEGFDLDWNTVKLHQKNRLDRGNLRSKVTYTSLFIGVNADDSGMGNSITIGDNNSFAHKSVILNKKGTVPHRHHHRFLQNSPRRGNGCPYATMT